MWRYGVQVYAKEILSCVERIYGCLPKDSTPISVIECHLELDDTSFLELDDNHKFEMLLGMLQWMVTIGKPELCQAFLSLNRLEHTLVRVIWFLQHKLIPDFIKDYPDAKKGYESCFYHTIWTSHVVNIRSGFLPHRKVEKIRHYLYF